MPRAVTRSILFGSKGIQTRPCASFMQRTTLCRHPPPRSPQAASIWHCTFMHGHATRSSKRTHSGWGSPLWSVSTLLSVFLFQGSFGPGDADFPASVTTTGLVSVISDITLFYPNPLAGNTSYAEQRLTVRLFRCCCYRPQFAGMRRMRRMRCTRAASSLSSSRMRLH